MYSKLQDGSFIACGFVARDSELKTVGEKNSSLCRWSVKAGEKENGGQKDLIWINCQAWHDTARVASAIKKGDTVLCVGKLETSEYNGKTYKNLVCEFVSIMKSPGQASATVYSNTSGPADDFSGFEEILGDGETPF